MNKQEMDILHILMKEGFTSQRVLSERSGISLGLVNKSLKNLAQSGMIDEQMRPTKSAIQRSHDTAPQRAVILAAGYGMRMVPINTETPKGLIEAKGEVLIERLIRQLHEAGIHDISVVVGFMKEQYEYLIDEFQVELIVNQDYAVKNNLHSLALASGKLQNAYVVPCDLWCSENPFSPVELYSWYMVKNQADPESTVRVNRKMELVTPAGEEGGNQMVGIAYLTGAEAQMIKGRLQELDREPRNDHEFWEIALLQKDKMIVYPRLVNEEAVVEINTYEQLRDLDRSSNHLKSTAIQLIGEALELPEREITEIRVLKKGMTNRSFLFKANGKEYIMRIPGEGTEQLINRREEADVYQAIRDYHICDEIVYINPENGYKITEYLPDSRVCDAENENDLQVCMKRLREFHNLKLSVGHEFRIYDQIAFYESLWEGQKSVYKDYTTTKMHVMELQKYVESLHPEKALTHIDAVCDNFLFTKNGEIRLIDWEYAGMQDPHVDIAMFCIYALYDRSQVDHLIDIYFENQCTEETRTKIYAYIASCGLLWSNWCEYKRNLGIEFGEYSLRQYRYAKEYYKIVKDRISEGETECIR